MANDHYQTSGTGYAAPQLGKERILSLNVGDGLGDVPLEANSPQNGKHLNSFTSAA